MADSLELLRETVSSLTESEASCTLQYIRKLRQESVREELKQLFHDALFVQIPENPCEPLPKIEPIHGKGEPASALLIQDRR